MAKLARFSALHQPAQKVTRRRGSVVVIAGPSAIITGTMTRGASAIHRGFRTSAVGFPCGSMTSDPANIWAQLSCDQTNTDLVFNVGTYTGPAGTVTVVNGSINGSSTINLTVGTITQAFSWNAPQGLWRVSGDPFGLVTMPNGTQKSISVTLP